MRNRPNFYGENYMSLDNAEWHWESAAKLYRKNHKITGEFTQEQVDEIWLYVSNHIGLFLKWLIDHNFR